MIEAESRQMDGQVIHNDGLMSLSIGEHVAFYRSFRGADRQSGVAVVGTEAMYSLAYDPTAPVRALSRFPYTLSPRQAEQDFRRAIEANQPGAH